MVDGGTSLLTSFIAENHSFFGAPFTRQEAREKKRETGCEREDRTLEDTSINTVPEAMTVTTIEPALTKKLLLLRQPKQRITTEAVLMANELLRLFIVEARQRAAIEVRRYVLVVAAIQKALLTLTLTITGGM
jgi:hypothetical protein